MTATSTKTDNTNRDSKRLPERIVTAILSQQDASERLVGWFQLAVVILFGLLYPVSPKTFSADETFTLVPWFLAVYLVVTLARLLISYRCRMTEKFAKSSAGITDIKFPAIYLITLSI